MKSSLGRIAGPAALLTALAAAAVLGYATLRRPPVAAQDAAESSARAVPVVVTPVAMRTFEERVVVQGNLEAKNAATVSARVGGIIEAIFVDEGDPVVAGETKLFQIDKANLQKAVDIARQDLAVAQCGLREKEANSERVQADFHKAGIDIDRFERLSKTGAVSSDALEQQQSRHAQLAATIKHAKTLIDLGNEQIRQAEAALAIAEKNLSDSLVVAPISGYVIQRFPDPGEMARSGDPVVRIEDPGLLEASAFMPAQYYPRIVEGKTQVRVAAYGIDAGICLVSYRAPTINPKLRTFEIKCLIQSPPEGVVSGAMAEFAVLLDTRQVPGVPTPAIQRRNDRDVLFTLDNGVAHMIPVETGLQTDGWTELLGGAPPVDTPVVTMGQFLLNDGAPVTVQQPESGKEGAA